MGLQAHPCSNKRTIEGLEEPASRTQQHHYNNNNHQQQQAHHQLHSGPRAAKQQCTIRVGVEAPDHLAQTLVPGNCASGTESMPVNNNNWYRDVQQHQTAPDYETYVNGFNAAEVRASTPYSASSATNNTYYSTGTSTHIPENVAVPAVEYSYTNNGSNNGGEVQYSSQNVYQNLTSMLPVANGGGESLADRFERVCSSPRPYAQYSGREEPAGYHYGNNESVRSDERYWTFGYTSTCPKKTGAGYSKCNNYGSYGENGFSHKPTANGYQQQQQQQQQQLTTGGGQTIQRDENGKSYLELGAKAAVQPEWVRPQMWPTANNQASQQQHYGGAPIVKSCSKCGHVLLNPRSLPQPCYRHQRLSVLSLSMLKLNRYRQCSDPSLHRSVLICNTLRHIEDEMEREGLVCNPSAEASTATATAATTSATNNCDTCCCSHCGTVFNNTAAAAVAKPDNTPPTLYSSNTNNTGGNNSNNNVTIYDTSSETNFISDYGTNNQTKSNSVVNADEDDSGFGDEDSRDIDWSSVFSMSTASGFEVSSAGNSNASSSSSDSYLCDSNSSDPSLFAGATGPELVSELGLPNWKSSHCGSATNGHSGVGSSWTSDSSDFSGVRWKSELGEELEGFVHILVGS